MKTEKRITLKELARKLDVSPSTVSRALQNHPSIGKDTCKKVQKMAHKLGYFPNSVASNLRRQKTNLIGVIVPRIDRHFHSYAISGIEEVANKAGYFVSIFQTHNSYTKEKDNIRMLLSNNADGVIACLALETKDFEHFELIKRNNIPLVFYDRTSDKIDSGKVIIDDYAAAYKATEHLISMGCKKIAHIAGNQNASIFKARLKGYEDALEAHGFKRNSSFIKHGNKLTEEEGQKFVRELLEVKTKPDGIFCSNDNTAIGVIREAKKRNIQIPEKLAVIGFSNTPASTIVEPALSTIDDHAFEMGQAAAKLLIRQIEDGDKNVISQTVVIKNELIIRDSTMRLNS